MDKVLAGIANTEAAAATIKEGGAKHLSTFYGFYMLEALAKAGEIDAALKLISDFWEE